MSRVNRYFVLSVYLVAVVLAFGSPLSGAEDAPRRHHAFVSGPVGGAQDQIVRVVVAALPSVAGQQGASGVLPLGDALVHIEAYDTFATDGEPIAEWQVRIDPGRSAEFDLPFRPVGGSLRQEVVFRAELVLSRPRRIGPVVASIQIFDAATGNTNQLWGDWFIIND